MAATLDSSISIPTLYTGETTLPNGETVYFGFESADLENSQYWYGYQRDAQAFACLSNEFCREVKNLTYPNDFSESFGQDADLHERVRSFIQEKEYHYTSLAPFDAVKQGAIGMEQVLVSGENPFIVYASKNPINSPRTDKVCNPIEHYFVDRDYKTFGEQYREQHNDIIMSMAFLTGPNVPTVTHYGIFRNPLSFFDPDQKYRGISMLLHGFAAQVALTQFVGKKYMVTNPMESMSSIMAHRLGADKIHIGTNKDWAMIHKKSKKRQNPLRDSPGIFHIDTETGIEKIAKIGTDLAEFPDHLPDELADFIAVNREQIDFSGSTPKAFKTVVELYALAKCY